MSCEESIGDGRVRPHVAEEFPLRGTAGHIAELVLKVRHQPGETIFPAGIEFIADSDEAKELKSASFELPSTSSLVKPSVVRGEKKGSSNEIETLVRIPLIPLPSKAGKHALTLPRLPITVARASGKVDYLCTGPHVIEVSDAVASVAAPTQKPDPGPRPQLEVWVGARDAVLMALLLVPVLLGAYFLGKYLAPKLKRSKPLPPPVPPWEAAIAELREIERSGLLEKEEYREYLARVTDTLRTYLGNRYGFDGLESTTRELLRELGARATDFPFEGEVRSTLHRADLVKFARKPPELEECKEAISTCYRIVEKTIPPRSLDPRAPSTNHAERERR